MDNRLIDVAIGLALVFAMTSLMVTTLQEILSQWNGKRGEVLMRALVSFAGDDEKFVEALLAHPLIKSLSDTAPVPVTGLRASPLLKWLPFVARSTKAPRKPSYIEADSLVSALIGQLVQTHMGNVRPQTPIELTSVVLKMAENPPAPSGANAPMPISPNLAFAQGLATLANGVEHDWPAFEARIAAWYDAVNERATGWFKRGVRVSVFFVGLATAAILNINPIEIGSRLWEDEAMRAAVVSAARQTLESQGADKTKLPPAPATTPVPPPSANPLAAANAPVRIEQAMETLGNAVFVEGEKRNLSAALQTSLSDVAVRVIALDSQLKTALKMAEPAQQAALLGRVAEANDRLLNGLGSSPVLDSLRGPHRNLRDALAAGVPVAVTVAVSDPELITSPSPKPVAGTSTRYAFCAAFKEDSDMEKVCQRMADLTELQRAGLPIGWTDAALPRYGERCVQGNGKPCAFGELVGHGGSWLNLMIALLGWVITAFACTLGAPFWFDALSKLVKLRSSGSPPATAKGADSSSAPPGSQLARSAASQVAGVGATGAPLGGPAGQGDEFALKPRIAMSDALNDAERALDTDGVKRVQRGIEMAEADVSGWFDGATRQAIAAWQRRMALEPVTGELSISQIASLLSAPQPDAPDGQQHLDGCDVAITDPTDDASLPGARGGVA